MSTRSYQRWTPEHWDEYAVIDSGDGARLERFGDLILDRPDPAAVVVHPGVAAAAPPWGIVLHRLDRLGKTDEARAFRARVAA